MIKNRECLFNKSESFKKMKEFLPYEKDEYFIQAQKDCSKLLKRINRLSFYQNKKRNKLFKKLFAEYGENNTIKEGFVCNLGFNIKIGNNCYFNFNTTIIDSYSVEIGNNVFIAPNVIISPVEHSLLASERRKNQGAKIVIEDDVWIGAGAIILPGVTLKKGCVVGAGAVVKKDVEANTVVVGVPARFIKKIDN